MKINITVLLDRSGSMEGMKNDHIGGIRSFVHDQQNKDGETRFSLVQFDTGNPFELVIDNKIIENVNDEEINLIPRGGTPLLDAVGKTIAYIEEQEKLNKSDQVIFMIVTDGQENSSKEWTKTKIKSAIEQKQKEWVIMFLGADINAFDEASAMGLNYNFVAPVNYSNKSAVDATYQEYTSGKINALRGMMHSVHATGLTWDNNMAAEVMSYTEEDRQLQAQNNKS